MSQDPQALLEKARKAEAKAGSGWNIFGGGSDKWEQAVEAYTRAANAFRMMPIPSGGSEEDQKTALKRQIQANINAGQAFEKIARIQTEELKEESDAANTYIDAFKVYKNADPDKAANCLKISIAHYTSSGNFRRAATHQQNLAELYETIGDTKSAIESYQLAASWFENDGADALASRLWLKVAELAAMERDYYKSIELFEKVAAKSLASPTLRYSAKDHFLKAGLCHLAVGDQVATNRALEKYRDMDPSFAREREHQLLCDIYESVEAGDQEMFQNKLYAFDQMTKLDGWKSAILVQIKNAIEEKGEDFS